MLAMDYLITTAAQLAQVIESYRKQQQLTQAELGARLGISQQSYARMVAKPGSTSVDNLIKIVQALGIRLVLQEPTATHTVTPSGKKASLADKVLSARKQSESMRAQPPETPRTPRGSHTGKR
jgi:HTH-type transcriptional regulator / antitoxin HipB